MATAQIPRRQVRRSREAQSGQFAVLVKPVRRPSSRLSDGYTHVLERARKMLTRRANQKH